MYTPKPFAVDDAATLCAFMDAHGFATLVTAADGLPVATHLPFLVEDAGDGKLVLRAHMARANPQWRDFARVDQALVVFQGPHAYVSPTWYENPNLVPTWNYTVVHAYGRPRLIEEGEETRRHIERLVARHESALEAPWSPDKLDRTKFESMVRGIVAFEIAIKRLEGKFKLNQNRTPEDRLGAARALAAAADPMARDVARLMGTEEPA